MSGQCHLILVPEVPTVHAVTRMPRLCCPATARPKKQCAVALSGTRICLLRHISYAHYIEDSPHSNTSSAHPDRQGHRMSLQKGKGKDSMQLLQPKRSRPEDAQGGGPGQPNSLR